MMKKYIFGSDHRQVAMGTKCRWVKQLFCNENVTYLNRMPAINCIKPRWSVNQLCFIVGALHDAYV